MPRINETSPARLLNVKDAVTLDDEHTVCVVTIETDDGEQEFAVNRALAADLITVLADFLGGPYPDDEEREAANSP